MVINDWIHIIAGVFILSSLTLGTLLNPLWYLVAGFVGLNLFQYGFTKFCPMAMVMKRLGMDE